MGTFSGWHMQNEANNSYTNRRKISSQWYCLYSAVCNEHNIFLLCYLFLDGENIFYLVSARCKTEALLKCYLGKKKKPQQALQFNLAKRCWCLWKVHNYRGTITKCFFYITAWSYYPSAEMPL